MRCAALFLIAAACGRSELSVDTEAPSENDGASTTTSVGAGPSVGGGSPIGGSPPEGGFGGAGPEPLLGDVFDPGEVYLAGTIIEGSCGFQAFVHWAFPESVVAGADCDYSEGSETIRATDGRLVYGLRFDPPVREFRCDACPFSGNGYPDDALANDPLVHPGCDQGFFHKPLVSPDGVVLARCEDGRYLDLDGNVAVVGSAVAPLEYLGYDGLVLGNGYLATLYTEEQTPIEGLPAGISVAARARVGGFSVVRELDGGATQLFDVDASGLATFVGEYPPGPPGIQLYGVTSKLDSSLRLFELGVGPEVFEDVIVRRTIGGSSEVVYDEADDPLVKIHINYLFTGP